MKDGVSMKLLRCGEKKIGLKVVLISLSVNLCKGGDCVKFDPLTESDPSLSKCYGM